MKEQSTAIGISVKMRFMIPGGLVKTIQGREKSTEHSHSLSIFDPHPIRLNSNGLNSPQNHLTILSRSIIHQNIILPNNTDNEAILFFRHEFQEDHPTSKN
jgi:hypothetical protein